MNLKQKIRLILSAKKRDPSKSNVWDFIDKAADKLQVKERKELNEKIRKAGMDGNGRFDKIDHAISKLHEILDDNKIEIDDVMSSHRFMSDTGTNTFHLARKTADSFSPLAIKNSRLSFSWHKLDEYKYEIVAYLT